MEPIIEGNDYDIGKTILAEAPGSHKSQYTRKISRVLRSGGELVGIYAGPTILPDLSSTNGTFSATDIIGKSCFSLQCETGCFPTSHILPIKPSTLIT